MAGLATVDSITNPDAMFENAGITNIIEEVTQVDTEKKKVVLSNGTSIDYEKIILGIGSVPVIPPIEGIDLEGVLSLRTAVDAEKIKRFMEEKKPKNLVFIGAGFINLELCALLSEMKPDYYNMTVIEFLDYPLPLMLDSELADKIKLEKEQKFALAISEGKTQTQAALDSHDCSSLDSAKSMGYQLMQKPDIQTAVAEIMQETGLTRRYRVQKLKTHIDHPDPNVSLKGLDQSWKLDGAYTEKHVHVHMAYPEMLQKDAEIQAEIDRFRTKFGLGPDTVEGEVIEDN